MSQQVDGEDQAFLEELSQYSDEEIMQVLSSLPDAAVASLGDTLAAMGGKPAPILPVSPIAQAMEYDPKFRPRPHLQYLSDRLVQAVIDVENGHDRKILISMPPRSGKSQMTSAYFPLWLIRRQPTWKMGLISHNDGLTIGWSREIRNAIEENTTKAPSGAPDYGVKLKRDGGGAMRWTTTDKGSVVARSVNQSVTGLGFKVMLIDDAVKDFASAHSPTLRDHLWNWWTVNATTRLETPYLVIMIGTRWHEDDLLGRVRSKEYPGDPSEWEVISFPALAEENDVLGRAPGEPLISPLMEHETKEQALERWNGIKDTVGSYAWAALYQQRPAPSKGAIFDVGWWRYWTTDPEKATDDGRVVYFDPNEAHGGHWLDSWDTTFKGTGDKSDYVVGQRWVRQGANRYLIAQQRGHWSFTQTLDKIKIWDRKDDHFASPFGKYVHTVLIENSANGPAIMDTFKDKISGLKPITAKTSKEARARAITPECESGNVILPLPSDNGNEWVTDLLSELRSFPFDAHDDQVDSFTQALQELRGAGEGGITIPTAPTTGIPGPGPSRYGQINRNYGSAARTMGTRRLS